MKKQKVFAQRLLMLLISAVLLSSFLAFSSIPKASAEYAPENGGEINALPLSYAWVTSYNGAGGFSDLTSLAFGHDFGYNTEISAYVGEVIDTLNNSYVINWRPIIVGKSLRVCGIRVAYRLPLGGGNFDPYFSYAHIPGSVLLPRDSTVGWASDNSGGCIYLKSGSPYVVFNINLNIPTGSRIDYLRVFYYRDSLTYLPFIKK